MRIFLLALAALVVAPAALAVGPWLGTATTGEGYLLSAGDGVTRIGTLSLAGDWGLPRVTMDGDVGGLARDGRTLVLSQDYTGSGQLQRTTRFAVLATRPLRLRRIVTLRGDFGFDALSPNGRTLYLIQHVSQRDLFRYRVRAYDLATWRLLPRVIADRRQRGWLMDGFPVSRATSSDGRWVYTLYYQSDNYPFVHALDTVRRTAVCIGLPWDWTKQQAIMNARLRVEGSALAIGGRFLLDRRTFRVRGG